MSFVKGSTSPPSPQSWVPRSLGQGEESAFFSIFLATCKLYQSHGMILIEFFKNTNSLISDEISVLLGFFFSILITYIFHISSNLIPHAHSQLMILKPTSV